MTTLDCLRQMTNLSCDNFTKCVRDVLKEGSIKPDDKKM